VDVEAQRVVAEADGGAQAQGTGGGRVERGAQGEGERVDAQAGVAVGQRGARPPPGQRDQHRFQVGTAPGEPVGAATRRWARSGAGDDPGLLEVAQPLGQHVLAEPGQAGGEVGEALGAEQQFADDEQGPALTDDVQGAGDSARVVVAAHGSECCTSGVLTPRLGV
jgi:hypothetical protein